MKNLSKKFSLNLQNEIGLDNLKEVVKRNSKETNINICHSHDFCDANQIMLDTIKFKDDENIDFDIIFDEMTKIWDIAKNNNFYI